MNSETNAPIYILCLEDVYETARTCGSYIVESLNTEGFLHASPADKLDRVANLYFGDALTLTLLTVDPAQVAAEVRWEIIRNGDIYPHIYGPLNMDAVTAVTRHSREAGQSFEISL